MLSLAHLMADVDGSLNREGGEGRARTLSRITDLLVGSAEGLTPDQLALFDSVIQRFATAIETRARVELAERLARLANGPRGVLLELARDEIIVARPVLAFSPCLTDQDLLAVAHGRGRDHMLAICERPTVSETVTDLLVATGDDVVRHAIAGNGGARFSPGGVAALLDKARADTALQDLLGGRADLSSEQARALVGIAKESAKARLVGAFPAAEAEIDGAVERGGRGLADDLGDPSRDYSIAMLAVGDRLARSGLTEAALAEFAGRGQFEETVAALASLTGLSILSLERIFEEPDNDLLLVIGKAKGWSWRTVRLLLQLRDPRLTDRHHFRRAEDTFGGLVAGTSQRVLHFLKVREATGLPASRPVGARVRLG